jgi:hypothetical protein
MTHHVTMTTPPLNPQPLLPAPEPEILAQIITLHNEITEAAHTSLAKAIILGGLLNQEKERLGHGHWLTWLKANVPFTERTARRYLWVFKNRDRLKSDTVTDLTTAYRLLSQGDQPSDLIDTLPDAETLAVSKSKPKTVKRLIHTGMMNVLYASDLWKKENLSVEDAERLLKMVEKTLFHAERLFKPFFAPDSFPDLLCILTKCNECRCDLLEYKAMKKKKWKTFSSP